MAWWFSVCARIVPASVAIETLDFDSKAGGSAGPKCEVTWAVECADNVVTRLVCSGVWRISQSPLTRTLRSWLNKLGPAETRVRGHVAQWQSYRWKVLPQIEFTARTCTWQGAASTLRIHLIARVIMGPGGWQRSSAGGRAILRHCPWKKDI